MLQKTLRVVVVPMMIVMLFSCTTVKKAIYSVPDFPPPDLSNICILPPVDLRVDKKINVNFERQIRNASETLLARKGYKVNKSDELGTVNQILEEDLKTSNPEWIKELGPKDSQYVMVLCLVDVVSKLTFGATANAELAGYLYNKQTGNVVWRDKGVGSTGQGGLIGMATKGLMDEEAIGLALGNLLASIPKKSN
jgi:hypothetical protein